MSKTTTPQKKSAVAAAVEILKANGGPMHVKAITEKVMADYDTGLKGKTPVATIGAKLHLAAKRNDTFVKTAPGTFGLLAEKTSPDVEVESSAVTKNAVVVRQGRVQVTPRPRPVSRKKGERAKAGAAA